LETTAAACKRGGCKRLACTGISESTGNGGGAGCAAIAGLCIRNGR